MHGQEFVLCRNLLENEKPLFARLIFSDAEKDEGIFAAEGLRTENSKSAARVLF